MVEQSAKFTFKKSVSSMYLDKIHSRHLSPVTCSVETPDVLKYLVCV